MHKCKYIKWLQGVSPTENVNYIASSPSAVHENSQLLVQPAVNQWVAERTRLCSNYTYSIILFHN